MDQAAEGEGPYTYYTYRSDESEYVNKLDITEGDATSEEIEVQALPFAEPSDLLYTDDNSYIKVEPLTNDKLGAYNGDSTQNKLYSTNWNKDTIAGVQLTTKYLNDEKRSTGNMYFYGFTSQVWNKINNEDTPTATPENEEERYAFRCELDLGANN